MIQKIFYYFDVYKVGAESGEEMVRRDREEGVFGASSCNASDLSMSFIDPRELLCAMRVISNPGLEAGEDHVRYWFDLYSHTWLVLEENEQISLRDGTLVGAGADTGAGGGGRRTAGGGSSLLPSSWSMRSSGGYGSSKYNAVGVRSKFS